MLANDLVPVILAKGLFKLFGNILGNLGLHSEDTGQVGIVSFCPKMRVTVGINQLRRDSDLVSVASYASFQDMIHIELPRNLLCRLGGILVLHHRGSRCYPQSVDT